VALLTAAGALLAVPAIGQADRPSGGVHHDHSKPNKRCKKPTVNKGFVVKGTLVSYTADNPATPSTNESRVEVTVTRANRHARVSGELKDTNPTKPGVQVAGGSYTVDASGTDPFGVRLSGYETGETPGAGDKVRIAGKIAVQRKKCAKGASLDDRYGKVNVRRVKIVEVD